MRTLEDYILPGPTRVKVFGDLRDDVDAIPDHDGGYWVEFDWSGTGGVTLDLSEHFKFVEGMYR